MSSLVPPAAGPGRPLHVAFFSIPAAGHVHPGLGLVAELVGRGHRVTYAMNAAFAAPIAAAGATVVPYVSTPAWANGPDARVTAPGGEMMAFLAEAAAVLPQLLAAYAGDRPDVVVYDIGAWPAQVLAHRWGIPALQLSPTFVAYDGWEEDFAWDPGAADAAQDADATGAEPPPDAGFPAAMQGWLEAEGYDGTFTDLLTPRRSLVCVPRSLQPRADTSPPQCTFVGPMLGDRGFQGDWSPPAGAGRDGRPVLLVSFGSAYTDRPAAYRACLEAFVGTEWHVVLATGRHVGEQELGPLPANAELHAWIPQLAVLRHAAAFVSHGGMGGTLEALSCGVPVVAVPQIAEQHVVARRLAALGLGRHLPERDVTAQAVGAAVRALVDDPGTAPALAAMRADIAAAGGAPQAADIVEEQAGEGGAGR